MSVTPKKKILGPVEIVTLLGVLVLIAYITLKSGGGKVYEKTEATQITNNPTGDHLEYTGRRPNQDAENERVEEVLRQISNQFGKDKVVTQDDLRQAAPQMSDDELRYINQVRQQSLSDRKKEEPINWFQILKTSHQTYSKVKDVFRDAGVDVSDAERGISTAILNEAAERTIYDRMERYFGIPAEKTSSFARSGQKKISDWAQFVDEGKN